MRTMGVEWRGKDLAAAWRWIAEVKCHSKHAEERASGKAWQAVAILCDQGSVRPHLRSKYSISKQLYPLDRMDIAVRIFGGFLACGRQGD